MKKVSILYIGNKLSSHGYNQTSIETLGSFLSSEGFEIITSSSIKNQILRLIAMCWSVVNHRNDVQYILIDTYSTHSFWYAFFTSQLARFYKIKYIPILRGGELPNRLKNSPYFSKLLFKHAHHNIAPSHYLQKVFNDFGFENIVFIPNSIEHKKYQFRERNNIEPKILWVRAFASIYNPKMAIDVFAKIKQNYPKATLCMIGPDKDGSLETTKSYSASLGLETIFTGGLPKETWNELAKEYDVFINTTHFDNTPVSVIEAMALGLPVVSTNVGGIPYLLEDKNEALLVNDNDVNAMAKQVEYLLTHPAEVSRITQNALNKVKTFDWEVVKYQWFELLS